MASGPVSRTDRPNTWLHRPALRRDQSLDNQELSTHGPLQRPLSSTEQSQSSPKFHVRGPSPDCVRAMPPYPA